MNKSYRLLGCLLVSIAVVNSENAEENEKFNEELYLKPLPNGDLLAHFSFDITSSNYLQDPAESDFKEFLTHFDLMPKVVGEFFTDHGLEGNFLPHFFYYCDTIILIPSQNFVLT